MGLTVEIQTRFHFTYNYLVGAASMTRLAEEIENKGKEASESEILQHRAFVAGSIMQSITALESEIWCILNYGPCHHCGSFHTEEESNRLLSIVAENFEKEDLLNKYDLTLQLVRNKKLDLGIQPMQDLKLVIRLRNELIHFKSFLTKDLDRIKLFNSLKQKDSLPPKFYVGENYNFFPHICLTFRRAGWALNTTVSFIEFYYGELGIPSPLEGYDRKLIEI